MSWIVEVVIKGGFLALWDRLFSHHPGQNSYTTVQRVAQLIIALSIVGVIWVLFERL